MSSKYKNHPWDRARKLKLQRPYFIQSNNCVAIDPGVNYFILQMERISIETVASCEGHFTDNDKNFYLMFSCTSGLAFKIANLVPNRPYTVSIGFRHFEYILRPNDLPWRNERHKRKMLREWAMHWERELKPLFDEEGKVK